jgi:hypothetical protein
MAALVPVLLELRHITVRTVLSDLPVDEVTSLAFVQMISHCSHSSNELDEHKQRDIFGTESSIL